eukprot:scaffold16006_cov70-Cyclotella_meneghiniana.AAC.9
MSDAEIDDIGRRFNCNGVKTSYLSCFPELKQLDKISDYSTKDEVCCALLNYVNGGRSNPMYSDETRARLDNYIAVLVESINWHPLIDTVAEVHLQLPQSRLFRQRPSANFLIHPSHSQPKTSLVAKKRKTEGTALSQANGTTTNTIDQDQRQSRSVIDTTRCCRDRL